MEKRAWIILITFLLVGLLFLLYFCFRIPGVSYCEEVGKYSLAAETERNREEFFEQFGFDAENLSVQEIVVPSTGENFEKYNELQKSQGLDLSPYIEKKSYLYTYKLNGDKGSGKVLYGSIIVYRNRVIGAHITDGVYPATLYTLTLSK